MYPKFGLWGHHTISVEWFHILFPLVMHIQIVKTIEIYASTCDKKTQIR